MFLMPVVPEVAVAKTTYEQPESTVQFDTELRQASYTVNVSDIVATGYVEEKETGMYAGMAIAIADPYTQVYAMADENSEVVGQMGQNSIASAEEIVGEWTRLYPVILQDLLRQVNYVLMKKHRHLEAA